MRRELTLREIQLRELDILRQVAAWLDENGIRYSLSGGTLLGAIRHDGFIPWDDDVDICIPRPDYQRMCRLLRARDCRIGELRAHLPGERGYYSSFVKFMDPHTLSLGGTGKGSGIPLRIDAFPMDHLPVNREKYHRQMRTFRRLRYILWSANRRRESVPEFKGSGWRPKFKWKVYRAALHLVGGHRNASRLVDLHARWVGWRNRAGGRWGNITWTSYADDYFDSTNGGGFITQAHTFEDAEYRIVREYDQYLTVIYGDYMTPPPVEKRDGRHNRIAYVLEEE